MGLLENILLWGIVFFLAVYGGILLVLCIGWFRTNEVEFPDHNAGKTRFSVVVVARNEEDTIISCLESISRQRYPKLFFEIIVADDSSGDTTREKTRKFIREHPEISIRLLDGKISGNQFSPKKSHITRAVNAATGEWIVTTDADCAVPVTWLESLAGFLEKENPVMILGPVMISAGNSFLEKFQSLEFSGIQIAAGGSAFFNRPVLCNGANLGFRKDAFLQVRGYDGNEKIISGDDIFLMNKLKSAYPGKIKFLKNRNAIVTTLPEKSFASLISQRVRWISKSFGQTGLTAFLGGFLTYLCCFLPAAFLVLSAYNQGFIYHFSLLVVFLFGIDLLYLYLGCLFFRNSGLLKIFPGAFLFRLYYVNVAVVRVAVTKRFSWKGRMYRLNTQDTKDHGIQKG